MHYNYVLDENIFKMVIKKKYSPLILIKNLSYTIINLKPLT